MLTQDEPGWFDGVFAVDSRGVFSKTFGDALPIDFRVDEIFWSTSKRGVVRGLHFQTPDAPIAKLVWVSSGSAYDVAVDLRDHAEFGTVHLFDLDASRGGGAYIPAGFAHGFQALEEGTIVNYAQQGVYVRDADAGIRWDSARVDWPLPIGEMSDRDRAFPTLLDYAPRFPR